MKTIELEGITYQIRKPGYKILKLIGKLGKLDKKKADNLNTDEVADLYRDLILLSVEEPKLTKEEVEELEVFFELGEEILEYATGGLKGFREKTSKQKSKVR